MVDLESTNGIAVNGRRVPSAPLAAGRRDRGRHLPHAVRPGLRSAACPIPSRCCSSSPSWACSTCSCCGWPAARCGTSAGRRPSRPGSATRSVAGGAPAVLGPAGGGAGRRASPAGEAFGVGPGLVIGRALACEITIEDSFASGRHARLYDRDGHVYIEDMNSTNGTYVNGSRVERPAAAAPRRRDPHRRHRAPVRAMNSADGCKQIAGCATGRSC